MSDIKSHSPLEMGHEENHDMSNLEDIRDENISSLPDPKHLLLRRRILHSHRDIDTYSNAVKLDKQNTIVTGLKPEGKIYIGDIIPLYFAKYMQEQAGSRVYILISDDERYHEVGRSTQTVQNRVRRYLKNVLAVGFNQSNTRIILSTSDADLIYPLSNEISKNIPLSEIEEIVDNSSNLGEIFYPSVQVSHIILPQLIYGRHCTTVLSDISQDLYTKIACRISNDPAYSVSAPGSLVYHKLDPLKHQSTGKKEYKKERIAVTDKKEEIRRKIIKHSNSLGSEIAKPEDSIDPESNRIYEYLYYFFEPSDKHIISISNNCRNGSVIRRQIKNILINKIQTFLEEHRAKRMSVSPVREEFNNYRLTKTEKQSALTRIGYTNDMIL